MPTTAYEVVVHKARALEESVADGGAEKAEAALFEVLGNFHACEGLLPSLNRPEKSQAKYTQKARGLHGGASPTRYRDTRAFHRLFLPKDSV